MKVVVCTDGSPYSHVCCHYAAWLAEQMEVSIEILYVTDLRQFEIPAVADLSGSLGVQPFEGMISQLQELEEVKAGFICGQSLGVFAEAGVDDRVSFRHETGILLDVIRDSASSADLILMGKRGANANFATEHLGSMLERVVRAAKVPCFVTNREFNPIEEVTLAYDGGMSCRKALDYLVEHKELFASRRIHVVTCVEGHEKEQASTRLTEAEDRLSFANLTGTFEMLSGVVEVAIADYVKGTRSGMLILGAYGHTRIRELLLGSTTTELLRNCHVPVLCFR